MLCRNNHAFRWYVSVTENPGISMVVSLVHVWPQQLGTRTDGWTSREMRRKAWASPEKADSKQDGEPQP